MKLRKIGSYECDGRTMQCNSGRTQQNLRTLLSFTSIFSHGVPHCWFFSMVTGSCDGIFIKAKDWAGEKWDGDTHILFLTYMRVISNFLSCMYWGECPAGANVVKNGKHHGLLPPCGCCYEWYETSSLIDQAAASWRAVSGAHAVVFTSSVYSIGSIIWELGSMYSSWYCGATAVSRMRWFHGLTPPMLLLPRFHIGKEPVTWNFFGFSDRSSFL